MEKPKIDEQAIKIIIARAKREIEIRGRVNENYIQGYCGAIFDFLWDYVGRSHNPELWAKCILEMHKIQKVKDAQIEMEGG